MCKEEVTDYGIVERDNPERVVRAVHGLIEKGWEPQGGVTPVYQLQSSRQMNGQYWFSISYVQAVVKRRRA